MKKIYLLIVTVIVMCLIPSCKERNEPSNNQESVAVTMQDITCTATTAHIVFNLKYTNAHIKDAGLMYGLTSQNTSDWLFATLSSSNLATIQSKTSGSYDISFDLKSLNTGYRYGVYAYAITQDDDITMTSEYNFTPSGSSSGGTSSDEVQQVSAFVVIWRYMAGGYDEYSWEKKTMYVINSLGRMYLSTNKTMSGSVGKLQPNTDRTKGGYNVSGYNYYTMDIPDLHTTKYYYVNVP